MLYRFSILFVLLFTIENIMYGQVKYIAEYGDENVFLGDNKIPREKPFSLLYFHFKGCPGCEKMDQTTFKDSAVVTFMKIHFHSYSINTLSKEGQEIRKLFGVGPQPDIIIIDTNKNVVHRILGALSPTDFLKQLQYAISPDKSLKQQKNAAKEKEKDHIFMEWYVRNLDIAGELDSLTITKAFNAFPENTYSDSLFVNFFFDFCMYEKRPRLSFQSKPYQFFVNNPELLYNSFDSSDVAYRFCSIAEPHLTSALQRKDEKAYLEAQKVITKHWRDNVYYIKNGKDEPASGIQFNYYKPLTLERDYQYYFKKDTVTYNRLEQEYFDKIKGEYQSLYLSALILDISRPVEKEVLTRKMKYVDFGLESNKSTQLYTLKSALLYLSGNKEQATNYFNKIKVKDLADDMFSTKLYTQLTKKLGATKSKKKGRK